MARTTLVSNNFLWSQRCLSHLNSTVFGIHFPFIILGGVYTDECPAGWMIYAGNCFLFGSTRMTGTDAQKYCKQEGGELARVTKAGEQIFMYSQLLLLGNSKI